MELESGDEDGRLHLNGIDALTGLPTVAAMTQEKVARHAAGGPPTAEDVGLLRNSEKAGQVRYWQPGRFPLQAILS